MQEIHPASDTSDAVDVCKRAAQSMRKGGNPQPGLGGKGDEEECPYSCDRQDL